jgi:hypothetical protein
VGVGVGVDGEVSVERMGVDEKERRVRSSTMGSQSKKMCWSGGITLAAHSLTASTEWYYWIGMIDYSVLGFFWTR